MRISGAQIEFASRRTTRADAPSVALLVLTWNNYADTAECVESLLKIEYANFSVVVIDNNSTDGSLGRLKCRFPQVAFIENEENLGFSAAMNRGMIYAFGRGFDYALLLNNDLTVAPDFLSKLVTVAANRPDLGVLSPAIHDYATGALDNAGWRVHRGGYVTKIRPGAESAPVQKCDFVSGCAMLVKREVVLRVGLLREDLYFLCEDLDYGLRCGDAGYGAATVTGARVFHKNALSAPKDSPIRLYYATRNHLVTLFRHRRHVRLLRSLAAFILFDVRGRIVSTVRDAKISTREKSLRLTAIVRGAWDGVTRRMGRAGVKLGAHSRIKAAERQRGSDPFRPPTRRGPPQRLTPSTTRGRSGRVLIVESGGGLGGSMRSLAVLLASPGWEKMRPEAALVNPAADARLLEKIGVRYRRLNAPVFEKGRAGAAAYFKMMWHLVKCFVFGRRFAAELRARRVALVHLNNEIFAGLPALFGALIAGVPVTCHLRSQRAPSFVERAASLFCRRFVCISETGARFFRKHLPRGSGARVCAINDPFAEADGAAVEERRETKNAPVVGMISNFVPGKGHEFFVEAIPLIAKRFPDARFLIAGAEVGEGGRLAALQAAAEANGACARLEFLPWQSDVPALLRRLDVLVDCSTLSEGYRRTIVEAMLAGAAVVATDVGPAREIIFDRQTGMLVPPGDGRAIAEAVSALLGDAGLRGKISGRGRALARRIFSRERTVGAMQKFLFESAGKLKGQDR